MYNVRKEEKITVLTIGWALLTKCENLVVPIRKEEGKILLQKKKIFISKTTSTKRQT